MPDDVVAQSTTTVEEDAKFLETDDPSTSSDVKSQETPQEGVTPPPSEEVEGSMPEESEEEKGESPDEEEEDESRPEIKDLPPHERPTIAQLKEKFPELFKTFPALRDVYFRESEYSKLFPSIEDAKEASENNVAFQNIREEVLSGDIGKFFTAVKEADEKSLEKICDNILPSLYKISPYIHWRASLPLLENVARSLFQEGNRLNNDDLRNSALHLSNFLFNDNGEVAAGKRTLSKAQPVESEERRQLEEDRKKFETQQYRTFSSSVSHDALSGLKALVLTKDKEGKSRIDPEGVFSDFIKNSIIDKVMTEVQDQMQSDRDHIRYMDSLWAKAKKAGYTGDWKSSIISAYLARAKSLVPAIRSRLVSEALGTSSNINGKKSKLVETQTSRKESGSSGREAKESKTIDSRRVDWAKTSDIDLLEDRVTYKR